MDDAAAEAEAPGEAAAGADAAGGEADAAGAVALAGAAEGDAAVPSLQPARTAMPADRRRAAIMVFSGFIMMPP
ncbi:hypothetical protein D3C76_1707360 [compost metagenome]